MKRMIWDENYWRQKNFLIKKTQEFFESRSYISVTTPMLVECPGNEVHLQYFETIYDTNYNSLEKFFLRTSPEMHMKELLGQGADKIFQIGACFRNRGELGDWHNPEFSMLEWYNTSQTFEEMVEETHLFIKYLASALKEQNFPSPLSDIVQQEPLKISVKEAFLQFAYLDLIDADPDLAEQAIEQNISLVKKDDDFETAFFKILLDRIEPALKNLNYVCLYDYPASQAALSKIENGFAKRFEFYLHGIELCNAFLELWDKEENKKRFEYANRERQKLAYTIVNAPPRFFDAFDRKLSSVCGNALGLDRLCALLMGKRKL